MKERKLFNMTRKFLIDFSIVSEVNKRDVAQVEKLSRNFKDFFLLSEEVYCDLKNY